MVIGISGRMQNGKDLTGKIIQILTNFPKMDNEKVIKDLDKEYYNNKFVIKKFADTLKDIVCLLIGCTREQLEDQNFKSLSMEDLYIEGIITKEFYESLPD